jgi:glucosamine--fructose-6-phosphate aminotransferase (isomerizing)
VPTHEGPGASESFFLREIAEQPRVLARLLDEGAAAVESAVRAVRAAQPSWALIAARGSSDNAARYGQYLLGARNGLGVGLAVPSLFTLYQTPPRLERALVIGISQSGQSPDIVSVLAEATRQGATTLALTNDPESPLSRAAAHTIPLLAGEERAVAATKTYSAELFALAMLSSELDGDPASRGELRAVVARVEEAIEQNRDLSRAARDFADADKFVVLGRGFNYATAFEVALKIKETSYSIAEPYSIADLLHGPIAMIDRDFPVILVAPSGKACADVPKLLDLFEERGARVAAISDQPEVLSRAHARIPLPADVPEWLSPLVAIAPGQLWASALAVARGQDPDRPRGLSKVTLTR